MTVFFNQVWELILPILRAGRAQTQNRLRLFRVIFEQEYFIINAQHFPYAVSTAVILLISNLFIVLCKIHNLN